MNQPMQIIRTGNPQEDQRLLSLAQAKAASQGNVLQVQPLPQGGFHVSFVPRGAPASIDRPPPGYGPTPGYGQPLGSAPSQQPIQMASPRAPSTTGNCQGCRRDAPTKQVSFSSNIGVIVMRFPRKISGTLCRRCVSKYFWEYTLTTVFLGWWGIISFFYSLVIIPTNVITFLGARDLPDEFSPGGGNR